MSNERFEVSNSVVIRQFDLKLLYVTKSKYEPDWHSTVHTHDFTEMFYVTKGKGNFVARNHRFSVKENDLVIVNPNVEHTEESFESTPLEYIVLGIKGLAFDQSLDGNLSSDALTVFNYKDDKKDILFYLNDIFEEVQGKRTDYETVCQNLIENLVIRMLRYSELALSPTTTSNINKDIAFVKHYIDIHFKEELTLQILADEAHMSKYYLIHLFKEHVGLSPINYLVEKRINESQTLLRSTNYNISQISSFVGFSSPSHFSYMFKKHLNTSPKKYREQELTNQKI